MPTENRSSNTEMVSDMLPCPFCGEKPQITKHHREDVYGFMHRCQILGPISWGFREDQYAHIEKWNARAQPAEMRQAGSFPQRHENDQPEQHQGEPVGWQFYQDGKWWNGDDRIKDHRKNTEDAGYPVRDVFSHADPGEVERLRAALQFYADRDHFSEDMGSDWDTVSGEPANVLWHESESWFVEDGSIARAALERKPEAKAL